MRFAAKAAVRAGHFDKGLLGQVFENGSVGLFARVLLNQSWAQAVGTVGLAAIGAVVVTAWAVRELRRWRIGPGVSLLGT